MTELVTGGRLRAVLLLTPADMDRDSAGQIYLDGLLSTNKSTSVINWRLPRRRYFAYSAKAGLLWRAILSLLTRLGMWQTLKLRLYEYSKARRDTDTALSLLQRYGTNTAWITLSTPESILLAHQLIRSAVRMRVTVWDPPEHLLSSSNIGRGSSDRVMRKFEEVLQAAASISVISENMRAFYQARYHVMSIVIPPVTTMPAEDRRAIRRRPTLRLVFAGSLYAKAEWTALVKSLASRQWRIAGRRVVVYFIGAFPLTGAIRDKNVKLLGYRSQADVAAISSRCDIAYLPYWLSEDRALAARMSFPSKLATYLSSCLPVLNHGPRTSEVTRILRDYPVGISCHSLAADEIASALEEMAQPHKLSAMQASIRELVRSELSSEVVGKRFYKFLTE